MSSKNKNAVQPQTKPGRSVRSGGGLVAVAFNDPIGINFTMPGGRSVHINGNAAHLRGQEMGILPVGAYGITMVNADDWEYIKKRYGGMTIFKSGLIFARDKKADAAAKARERAELRNGYEPIDPEQTATEPAKKEG